MGRKDERYTLAQPVLDEILSLPIEVEIIENGYDADRGGWEFEVRFLNGYGVSVINHDGSYGLEVMILHDRKHDTTTGIADDVVGWQGSATVKEIARRVAALPPKVLVADYLSPTTHGESEEQPMSPWEREFLEGFTYEKFADDPRAEHVASKISDAIIQSKDPLTSVELTALALKAVDEYDTKIRWRHVYVVVYRDDSEHGRIGGDFEVFTTREHAEKVATAKGHVLRASVEEQRAKNRSEGKIDRYEWDCYDVIEAVEYL